MSLLLERRRDEARRTLEERAVSREAYRLRWLKILCGVALGVCFYYSVPYHVPVDKTNGLANATAELQASFEGSTSRQIAMPIITAIAALMMWRLPKRGRVGGRLAWLAMLYVGWAALSCSWSDAPDVSLKRLVVFGMDAFFAYVMARTISMVEMAWWGFWATGSVALISLYMDVVVLRIFAPLNPEYRFTGVMEANSQAMNLVVFLVCAFTLMEQAPQWRRWIIPASAGGMALLYMTRSRLSTVICLGMMMGLAGRWARRELRPQARALVLVGAMAVIVPAAILVMGRGDGAVQVYMMGRNDTENTASLSNRWPLWTELAKSVEMRPWLGYGYEGFWTADRVTTVSMDQGWAVPNAHDIFLEQWLSLGVVGMLLYAGLLVGAVCIAWRRYRRERTAESLMAALLLSWLMLEGLAESVPLDPYLPTMLAYVCVAKMCLVAGTEAKSDAARGKGEIFTGAQRELSAW